VDLRSTGRLDLITGSMPGRLYLFRRNADGSFASREVVKAAAGNPLDAGSMTCVFAFDWFGTGKADLIVGTVHGAVTVCKNVCGSEPRFAAPQPILLKDGRRLTALDIQGCGQVRDLTPLQGMKLTEFNFGPGGITKGMDVLRQIKTLKTIGVHPSGKVSAEEFWRKYDAGEYK
jgi:hypothetical protein